MRYFINTKLRIFCLGTLLTICHSLGWAGNSPSGHDTALCGSCHQSGNGFAGAADRLMTRECLVCHARPATVSSRYHDTTRGQCVECHSFHEPGMISTTVGSIDLTQAGGQDQAHCRSCHDPRGNLGALSQAHREAAMLYHREADQLQAVSPSDACLRCHSNQSGSSWQTAGAGRILTFNTHASHPYGIKVTPGQGNASNWIATQIDERIPLFDGVMECQSCHLLAVTEKGLLIPFETKYDLCRGCHKHYGDEVPDAQSATTTLANR